MDKEFLPACFLGPAAENDRLLEDLVVEALRDHSFWRRNFHPEDGAHISAADQHSPAYREFVDRTRTELRALSADLKRAVPFFSPRYVGHMTADLLLPGVVARLVTTLYNPNNVSEEGASVTVAKELEAGLQLARMFGYATDSSASPCAWGHLTSGGTVANYEALWNARSVRFYPLALDAAARSLGVDVGLGDYTRWQLLNFSVDDTVALRRRVARELPVELRRDFVKAVRNERIESLGTAGFFLKHRDLAPPIVLVPSSAHYSWEKAMKVLGFGTAQLVRVAVDDHMRLDGDDLRSKLAAAHEAQTPVLAVIGVLGTTEFGTFDPIHEIVAARDECRARGEDFYFHIDAAWGGYLMAAFRRKDGSFAPRAELRKDYRYFPSESIYEAFRAVPAADSITVDPHKLGYVPYTAGAFIARNRDIVDFITQKAAYVFDLGDAQSQVDMDQKLRGLGQYILEGSKAGAAAAAVHVTHKVLPLHTGGFGKLLAHTVRACEEFYDLARAKAVEWKEHVTLTVPFEPDSNLVCLALNPAGNTSLAVMNRFGRDVFAAMKVDPDRPIQIKEFIGSYTSLTKDTLGGGEARRVLGELGIDPATFRSAPTDPERESSHVFLLRHTLMNPWLTSKVDGRDYVERFWDYLESLWRAQLDSV